MSFARKVAEAAFLDVEAGGAFWRIRNVTTRDLIMTGIPMLAKLPSVVEGEAAEVEDRAAAAAAMDPAAIMDIVQVQHAIVCAGVVAGRDGAEGAWEPLRIVVEQTDEDLEAAVPCVCVESLDNQTRVALFNAIMSHSSDSGRMAKALANFRGGPDRAATP